MGEWLLPYYPFPLPYRAHTHALFKNHPFPRWTFKIINYLKKNFNSTLHGKKNVAMKVFKLQQNFLGTKKQRTTRSC